MAGLVRNSMRLSKERAFGTASVICGENTHYRIVGRCLRVLVEEDNVGNGDDQFWSSLLLAFPIRNSACC